MGRVFLLCLGLAASPFGAQDFRFPTPESHVVAMQSSDAKDADLDAFSSIRILIGDFVRSCEKSASHAEDEVLWGANSMEVRCVFRLF